MQVFWTLYRRELGGFFQSMTGYVIISTILGLLGFSILDILSKLNSEPIEAPLTEVFYATWYFWLILLLTTPVITMRTFAAEKASGTYETLMTTPVGDLEVVLAKFAGTMTFYALTWLPLVFYIFFLHRYTNAHSHEWEPRTIITTYLGVLLVGSVYVSVGCFTSALTKSQIISAAISYAIGLTLFLLSLRSLVPIPPTTWQAKAFLYIAMTQHMQDFARGVLDTTPIVFYLSVTTFFVFITFKVVESRRWK